MSPSPAAVLFDIDGTLIDSNYLHIEAWTRAFHALSVPIDAVRVHGMLGMDSGRMLDAALGDRVEELGDRAKELHTRYFRGLSDRLRPFDGARDVIAGLSGRGVRVVLATSASEDELALLKRVLNVDRYLTDATSDGDVTTAKPEPDVVEIALRKAGVDASAAVFVGDTTWDAIAARRAGVEFIGVLSGGLPKEALLEAGATEVHSSVAEISRLSAP